MGGDFGFWDLQYSMRRAALVETCFSSLGRMVEPGLSSRISSR
jgi:hypothetical protein